MLNFITYKKYFRLDLKGKLFVNEKIPRTA